MSLFHDYDENISCIRCLHRHPANVTCREAVRAADAARAQRRRDEEAIAAIAEFACDDDPPRREGTKFWPLPEAAGSPLSLAVFEGALLVCCRNGVYRRNDDGSWDRLPL